MKKLLCLLFALGSIVAVSAQSLPDVKVENLRGDVISTRSLVSGKPCIVSFWSMTCKPCILELNTINDYLEEWREEADFDVIAVSTDDVRQIAQARGYAKSRGWDFICVFDKNQDFKRAMNVAQTPHSFVLDGEGNVVYSHSGYTPGSEQELFDKVVELQKK